MAKQHLIQTFFLRRLDIYRLAVQSVNSLDLTTVTILEAYAAGVNARLDQINTEALGRGAPEMFLFNASLAPWQPADSLAIIKLMGLHLASQMDNEILRARMSLNLQDPERLLDILPNVPGPGVASLAKYTALVPGTTVQFSTSPTAKLYIAVQIAGLCWCIKTRGQPLLRDLHQVEHYWLMILI